MQQSTGHEIWDCNGGMFWQADSKSEKSGIMMAGNWEKSRKAHTVCLWSSSNSKRILSSNNDLQGKEHLLDVSGWISKTISYKADAISGWAWTHQ